MPGIKTILQFVGPSFFEGLANHIEGLEKVLGCTQNLYLPQYQMHVKRHWTYMKRDRKVSVKLHPRNHFSSPYYLSSLEVAVR